MLRDLARERGVGVPGENFELVLDPVRHVLISSRRDHREIFQLSQITVGLGWAGRIRTFECQVQSLVPYQLGDRPAKRRAGLRWMTVVEPVPLNVLNISAERES